jgi:osmotically-inducible protein OsmY
MNDRYRRDHGYRDYGYDDYYGSIEQREDMGESPFRRGRSGNDRAYGQGRGDERYGSEGRQRQAYGSDNREQRFGSEGRWERSGGEGRNNRSGSEGRWDEQFGSDRQREFGQYAQRDEGYGRRDDEWNRGTRGMTQNYGYSDEREGMGMGTSSRDPYRNTTQWSRHGSGYGSGRYDQSRGQGMSSWTQDSSARNYGWSGESSAGARSTGFSGRGPKGYTRSDDRIREDVCDRLSDDDDLDASDISVTVMNGEVTLEGSVTDRRSKHRAEDIADSVSGVRDVHNRLRAQKSFFQEVGDRLMGRDEAEQHGHQGSGTRNTPANTGTTTGTSSTAATSGSTVKNGVTEPNRL